MHFFNIATNLTNGSFMIGYENDSTNFYLKGEIVKDKPLISCRILNSKGQLLLSMERNKVEYQNESISLNKKAKDCRIFIHEKQIILKIVTRDERDKQITYIEGQFYDKEGRLAARGNERGLLVNCPLRL